MRSVERKLSAAARRVEVHLPGVADAISQRAMIKVGWSGNGDAAAVEHSGYASPEGYPGTRSDPWAGSLAGAIPGVGAKNRGAI